MIYAFIVALGVILVVAKATAMIDWSWWAVLGPVIGLWLIVIIYVVGSIIYEGRRP